MTRAARRLLLLALLAVGLATWVAQPAAAQGPKPTVVLVHGAFADASGWNGVTARLQARGFPVVAPANPLRGVAADAQYLRDVLARIKGPIVLVGHSYGGVAITNAATGDPDVKALVYVAAFAPAEGESLGQIAAAHPGGQVGPPTLDIATATGPDGVPAPEGTIKASVFRKVFAADLPRRLTAVMAASQRPAALSTLTDVSGPPAWATIPSFYLLAGRDHTIGADAERFMAERMRATVVEAPKASHAVMLSRPRLTARLIERAAR